MLLYCCYTPAHEVLYRQVFLPSVPEGFEVRSTVLGIDGPGDYLSDEFLQCIRAKLDLVVQSVEENLGNVIVWSDVDIRFFDLTADRLGVELIASLSDLLFQRESPRMPDVNTGFFVCRCTPAVLEFFTTVRSELESHPEENEQMVVNRLLFIEKCGMRNLEFGMEKPGNKKQNPRISWGYLPHSFYARTQCWPPPTNLSLYHANCTNGPDGVGQKFRQFQEIEWIHRHGQPARIWSILRRVPGKLSEILRKINR